MLRVIPVKELTQYVAEIAAQSLPDVPITPLRALSQFHNPVAHSDDPALIVRYNEAGEVIAYFGCLPDRLSKTPDQKVCWSSCWWGRPDNDAGATMEVFYQALKLWNGQMLFDALPEKSEQILRHMKYFSFRKMEGMSGLLRFKSRKILTRRFPKMKAFGVLFSIADIIANSLYGLRLMLWKVSLNEITVEEVTTIDDPLGRFIEKHNQAELIGRDQTALNWILKHPWLEEREKGKGALTEPYYFSAYAKSFQNIVLHIKKETQTIALLFLTLRDGEMKLPYIYFEKEHILIVADVIIQQLVSRPVETFVCFHPELLTAFKNRKTPFYHLRRIDKTFGYSTSLAPYVTDDVVIQDGDGDVVFT